MALGITPPEICVNINLTALFNPPVPSLFIFPQPDKLRMPQVTIRRPFGEFDLGDQGRFKNLVVAVFAYLVLCAIVAVG
jgi:hypothetical protein